MDTKYMSKEKLINGAVSKKDVSQVVRVTFSITLPL